MTITLSILAAITVAWILAYHRANGVAWTIALAAAAVVVELRTAIPAAAITAIWIAIALFGLFSIVKPSCMCGSGKWSHKPSTPATRLRSSAR